MAGDLSLSGKSQSYVSVAPIQGKVDRQIGLILMRDRGTPAVDRFAG